MLKYDCGCARFATKNICAIGMQSKRTPKFQGPYAVGRLAVKGGQSRINQPAPAVQVSGAWVQHCRPVPCRGDAALSPIAGRAFAALAAGQNGDLARGDFSAVNRPARPAPIISTSPVDNIRGWRTHARITNLSDHALDGKTRTFCTSASTSTASR